MTYIKLCQIVIETQEINFKERTALYIENHKEEIILQTPNFPLDIISCEILQFESEENYNNLNGLVINLTQNITNIPGTTMDVSAIRANCLTKLKLISGLENIQ